MNKKIKNAFSIFLLVVGICSGVFQYVRTFQAEIASAYDASKPSVGHDWSEMQCTEDICIDTENHRVGIGTDSPSGSFEVAGDGLFSGDICIGSGACLSDIEDFVGSQLLINGVHTYSECNNAGGIVVDTSSALKQCRFDLASCPSGWTQYLNFSTTVAGTWCSVVGGCFDYCDNRYGCPQLNTEEHAWANLPVESCAGWHNSSIAGCESTAYPCCPDRCVCPTVTQIGCY